MASWPGQGLPEPSQLDSAQEPFAPLLTILLDVPAGVGALRPKPVLFAPVKELREQGQRAIALVGLVLQRQVQFGDVRSLHIGDGSAAEVRADIKASQSPILARGAGSQFRIDMLDEELVQEAAKGRSLGIRPLVAGRIASRRYLPQQPLGLGARLVRRQDAMVPEGHTPRSALATADPVLDQVDLAAGRRDLEAEAAKFVVPEVTVGRPWTGRVHRSLHDARDRHVRSPPSSNRTQ